VSSEIDKLIKKIDQTRIPQHVAIIMDGNGRWAKRRGLPRLFGHRAGAASVREVVEAAGEIGIKILTLYAFSTENWTRPKTEVIGLMKLLMQTLKNEEPNLNKKNVRLESIGDLTQLLPDVQEQFHDTARKLSRNTGLRLVLALNYGGRQDIVQACNTLISKGVQPITEKLISEHLYTKSYADPDLMIRTSGEQRISNFLLWQVAYSELLITPILWPDFRKRAFFESVLEYQKRERRYGGVN